MTPTLDHLVIAARTLEEGVAWCEATLGVVPGPGGAHPLMGTHNRLLSIASAAFPRSYLEVIAIDPAATAQRAKAGLARWFDLDDLALQGGLAARGPQLIHWVARSPDAEGTLARWRAMPEPIDAGQMIEASRPTPVGVLSWRIAVRDDGRLLFDGLLPTPIEWGDTHPADAMPDSGLKLTALRLVHPQAEVLWAALDWIDSRSTGAQAGHPDTMPVETGSAKLCAMLQTPRGLVKLESQRNM